MCSFYEDTDEVEYRVQDSGITVTCGQHNVSVTYTLYDYILL